MSAFGRKRSAAFGTRSDVAALGDLDLHVRRHARLQLQLRVRHVDDRAVGRHVLDDDRLQPDLRHRAVERVGRIGVDAERDVLTGTDAADVGFVDVRVDLHLRQVGGDDEERRRLHAGRDRLADVDAALDDDAVNRRRDDRVIEVDLVLVDRRLRLADRGLRLRRRSPAPTAGCACAESTAIFAASRSLCGSSCLAASSFARVYFCCASVSMHLARVRDRSAPWSGSRAPAQVGAAPAAAALRTATDRAGR